MNVTRSQQTGLLILLVLVVLFMLFRLLST